MVFEDRILVNPRLLRLKNPQTNEVIDWEIQDLEPEEVVQEGTEINAQVMNEIQTTVVDGLNSTSTTDALSANQGKVLNEKMFPMEILAYNYNIDNIKQSGFYGIFNATGTLPTGYSTSDNNIFIESIMWNSDYGRQILHDVRTNNTYIRIINNNNWQSWHKFTLE